MAQQHLIPNVVYLVGRFRYAAHQIRYLNEHAIERHSQLLKEAVHGHPRRGSTTQVEVTAVPRLQIHHVLRAGEEHTHATRGQGRPGRRLLHGHVTDGANLVRRQRLRTAYLVPPQPPARFTDLHAREQRPFQHVTHQCGDKVVQRHKKDLQLVHVQGVTAA